MEAVFLVCFLQALIFGAFCYYIAGQKNRDQANWLFLGFFFSFIALFALIAVPKIEEIRVPQSSSAAFPIKPTIPSTAVLERVCPHCAETIKAAAKICRFCQRNVQTETSHLASSSEVRMHSVDPDQEIDWTNKDEEYCLAALKSGGYDVVFSKPSKWSITSPSKGSTSFAYSIADLRRIAKRET